MRDFLVAVVVVAASISLLILMRLMIQVWWFGSQIRLPCDRSIDRMLCVWPKLIFFCALLHSHDQLILMMMIERSAPANASIDTHLLARVCVRYVCTNGFFTFYGMPDCSRHDYVIIECAKNCTQQQQQQSQLFGINCCIFAFCQVVCHLLPIVLCVCFISLNCCREICAMRCCWWWWSATFCTQKKRRKMAKIAQIVVQLKYTFVRSRALHVACSSGLLGPGPF